MKNAIVLLVKLLARLAILLGTGGTRAVLAENILLRQQLLVVGSENPVLFENLDVLTQSAEVDPAMLDVIFALLRALLSCGWQRIRRSRIGVVRVSAVV